MNSFGRWRRSRPFWAGLWAIVGGTLIAFGPLTAIKLLFLSGQAVWVGALVGILIVVCGLFFWIEPRFSKLIGALIDVLAVISLITSDLGGFFIGMLLALLGGSMGLAWVAMAPKEPRPGAADEAPAAAAG